MTMILLTQSKSTRCFHWVFVGSEVLLQTKRKPCISFTRVTWIPVKAGLFQFCLTEVNVKLSKAVSAIKQDDIEILFWKSTLHNHEDCAQTAWRQHCTSVEMRRNLRRRVRQWLAHDFCLTYCPSIYRFSFGEGRRVVGCTVLSFAGLTGAVVFCTLHCSEK